MRAIKVEKMDSGQRLDKFLKKYFCNAQTGFLYKMMRKKNIVLNQKKVTGNELLKEGDIIQVFFSEETFEKFTKNEVSKENEFTKAYETLKGIRVLFENKDVLVVEKPKGILCQKDAKEGYSLNEWVVGYLQAKGETPDLKRYRPSVLNRIDRNTSGIVLAGKTYRAGREITGFIRERSIEKYYLAVLEGEAPKEGNLSGFLYKDEENNKVSIYHKEEEIPKKQKDACSVIQTKFQRISMETFAGRMYSLVEVELITGKSHQIRAHFASIGFPLAGDIKYGGHEWNGKKQQYLHAYRIRFPKIENDELGISQKEVISNPPKGFWLTEIRK